MKCQKINIRPLTEKEQLEWLKGYLEELIESSQEELEEVKLKIKKLEINKNE